MMMRFLNYFLALITILNLSCNHEKSIENKSQYNLVANDVIRIPVGSNITQKSNASFLKRLNGKDYLFYLEKNENKILVIDFKQQRIINTIHLEFTGPNGVGKARGFFIHNFDSIFVTSAGDQVLYLADSTGTVNDKFDYSMTSYGEDVPMPTYSKSNVNTEIILNSGVAYLTMGIPGNTQNYSSDQITKSTISVELNLKNRTVHVSKIRYPDLGKKGYPLQYSRIYDGEKFVYTWLYSKNVYISSKLEKWDKVFELTTDYFSNFSDPMPSNPDFNDVLNFYISSPRIQNIFYNPYKSQYYIVVLNGEDVTSSNTLNQEMGYESNLSVIILNKFLEKVGETKLPAKKHIATSILLSKEGLYFSNHHKDNGAEFNDDYLSYTLYKSVKVAN